jgi:hypothetical protein
MEKETLKNIFNFLEKEENKMPRDKGSFKWKIIFNELTYDELNINGNLELSYTKVTSLPEGLKVRGNLNLDYSKITSLPEGLSVGGYFDLSNTNITSLPERLEVAGNLYLDYSFIKSLPKDLKVGGTLYIYKSPLKEYTNEELREMVKLGFLKGDIYRG